MKKHDRRGFIQGSLALAGLSLFCGCGVLPLPGRQPAKMLRIGYLQLRSGGTAGFDLFRGRLRELGYVDGQNIVIEQRWAEASEQFPALAEELVGLPVDLIVAAGTTPVKAAMGATRTIPIVFPVIGDPVGSGFVASLARPGGNVTGLSDQSSQLMQKRLQLLREMVPGVSRVMYLEDTAITEVNGFLSLRELETAAQLFDMQILRPDIRTPADLPAVLQRAALERAEALLVSETALISGERGRITEFATAARLPLMSKNPPFAAGGGLCSYGPGTDDLYPRAANIVDKILKGTPAGEIPIEQPTVFRFVINLKTARALGLTIPQSVLVQATEIIQ